MKIVGLAPYGLLTVLCLLFFLPGQTALPAVDRDEARFAQASKQMLESGDYVNIRFQNRPRYKKPVGIYWLQSLAAQVSGYTQAIAAYRIPSWLGAIAAVLLTLWVGTRLFDPQVGMLGALLLAGTLLLGVEARLAKTDAVLLACITAVQGLVALAYLRRGSRWQAAPWQFVTGWLLFGAGMLIKGPVIVLVVGLTILALAAESRSWRWLAALRPGLGVLLALLVVIPWLVSITLESHGRFWVESVGLDILAKVTAGRESHYAPPGTYSVVFWAIWWPVSILLALGLPWVWKHRKEPPVFFCLAWAVPAWLVFELIPTKLPHYVLPIFPPLALLAAKAWFAGGPPGHRYAKVVKGIWLISALGIPATLAGVVLYLDPSPALLPLALLAIVPVTLLYFLRFPYRGRSVAALLAGAWMFYLAGFQWLLPNIDGLWLSRQVVEAMDAQTSATCPRFRLMSIGYNEPSLVFLTGTDTLLIPANSRSAQTKAADFLAGGTCRMVLLPLDDWQVLKGKGQPLRLVQTIDGINYTKGKRLGLALVTASTGG